MTERPAHPLSLKDLAGLKEKPDQLDAMSYTVGADGDLMRREETNELRFGFTLKHHAFAGKVQRSGERASLSICGEIGHLPFSAQNSFARHSIKRVIGATDLLRHARFQVQPD